MKLIFVRHGDPDYSIDSLTEKGWKEAELLAKRLSKLTVKEFFCSPMGRAKDTASLTLQKMNRTAVEYEWLREFQGKCIRPDAGREMICWDFLPQDWTSDSRFFDKERWSEPEVMQQFDVKKEYDWVTHSFDRLLSEYGYVRDGENYRVTEANNDTLVFFCHFGVGCVLISHLLHVSPMILWHGLVAAPSSVSVLNTEERREGIAAFRMSSYGDISHLYAGGEPPAFAARFCECYTNEEERHD